MTVLPPPGQRDRSWSAALVATFAVLLAIPSAVVYGQQARIDVLHIGNSGSLASGTSQAREQGALDTLKAFIKDETGFNNEILRQKDWRELADKMAKGQLHLGVFQGYEFAWAQEKTPGLKPLAVAVNVHPYPVIYVVTNKANKAKDFAGLQGQSMAIPAVGLGSMQLFVDRQCQALGKKPEVFFSRITTPDNVEDPLDDVVDGVIQAAAVDRAALEAYRQRKPGRFSRLKEVARSQPFPPTVVAYFDSVLDQATLERFRQGLLNASRKERGQMLLTIFRLTSFQDPPADLAKVLAETRKAYPPPANGAK
jgi:ABC-type phosphate/phosphonate transport system substrate-binding protein